MAQKKLKINNKLIRQPDEGLAYEFETTYSEDSGRDEDGSLHETDLFTVERFGYTASWLTADEMKTILQEIVGKRFTMYYLSPYFGTWRTDTFYVGKGSLSIGSWVESEERYTELTFNIVGVTPIAVV